MLLISTSFLRREAPEESLRGVSLGQGWRRDAGIGGLSSKSGVRDAQPGSVKASSTIDRAVDNLVNLFIKGFGDSMIFSLTYFQLLSQFIVLSYFHFIFGDGFLQESGRSSLFRENCKAVAGIEAAPEQPSTKGSKP